MQASPFLLFSRRQVNYLYGVSSGVIVAGERRWTSEIATLRYCSRVLSPLQLQDYELIIGRVWQWLKVIEGICGWEFRVGNKRLPARQTENGNSNWKER